MNKYYIIDYGDDMKGFATMVKGYLMKIEDAHFVEYYTPEFPNGFMVTETSEDDFLMHFANTVKTKDNEE